MNPVTILSLLLCIVMMGQSDGAAVKRNANSEEENLLKDILKGLDLSKIVYVSTKTACFINGFMWVTKCIFKLQHFKIHF